jgi:uncharacterized repeat protein (TIGR01451 family)
MRGRGLNRSASSCGGTRRRRAVWVLAVLVAVVGFSLQASASTRLGGSASRKSEAAARHVTKPSKKLIGSSKFRISGVRRFMAAEKTVICHSTSSDTNPYSRIISAGTAGHDPSQGTHDLDLFGPPGDETFQCPGLLGITKVCQGGVTGSFTLHITNTYNASDATRTISCGERIRFPVLRGTVTITEDVPGGVTATFGGDCTQDSASSGHTTIGASSNDPDIGEAKECSITNAPKPTTMAVTKSCPNGADASSDLFNVVINGTPTSTNLACGESHTFTVSPGAISVTEAAAGTTNFANYNQSRSSGCDATLAQGDAGSCTLTNSLKPAQELKVEKSCPSGADASSDRFNVVINGTPTSVNLACGENHVFTPGSGTFTVTEAAAGTTNLSNYTQSSSGCTNVALARGGSQVTCTLTNTLKANQELKVAKSCPNGPDAATDRFNVVINGTPTSVNLACGEDHVFSDLSGTVTITEAAAGTTNLSNYTQSSSGCTSVALARGESQVTCTLTNTLKANQELKVEKSCPNGPDAATDRFNVVINGTPTAVDLACGENHVFTLAADTYSVTEAAAGTTSLSNYTQSSSGCTNVALARGGSQVTCTLTNALKANQELKVEKSCPNGPDAATDKFNVVINGTPTAVDLACGENHVFTPGSGTFTVTEAAAGTTNLANYTHSSSGCTDVALARGGSQVTCTLTNTLKANQELKVEKSCPNGPDAATDKFNVVINGDPTAVDLACGENHVFTLAAGTYSVTEAAAGTTNLANYTQSSSGCTNVALARGGSQVTCTLTNTLKALPTVEVTKDCDPNGGADVDDRFQITNKGSNVGDPLACEGSLTATLQPGAGFEFDELAGNATTDLANYTKSRSAGCTDADGLQRGESGSCTITNTLKAAPKVTVTKACPNGKANAGDRFQVKRNGSNVGDPLDCDGSTDVTVTAGQAYTITEGAAGATDLANYDTSLSEGCSGTLAHFGDTATCTITNRLKAAPKLTVIKHVVNDNGGTAAASAFTIAVSGSSPSPASFPGSEAGTVVTLQPGPYAVNEAAVAGYAQSKSAGCSGTLVHFGDTATCTVTNDDIAAPPPPSGPPLINLAITKVDTPDPVTVGALLTYTLTVTNKKGDTANNVVVSDSLPSEVTLVSVASTKGTCSGSTAITCNIGTVAFNELVTITIVVRPNSPGTITNTTVVVGREAEHDPSDNTASATTVVQGAFVPPSVCYSLQVTPRSLTVGRRTIVRVTVREAGKPVAGVQVVITGKGMTRRAETTNAGVARFVITAGRPGILQIRVPTHATCNRQRIGVLGVFTPPGTG